MRSKLLPELRRMILGMALALDDLNWAPEIFYDGGRPVGILLPHGWQFESEAKSLWITSRGDVDYFRRNAVKTAEEQ